MPNKKSMRSMRYDANHARNYGLKLNRATDADLIAKLDSVSSVNGYIRQLIRADIEHERRGTISPEKEV